jgi:hypothetical protein
MSNKYFTIHLHCITSANDEVLIKSYAERAFEILKTLGKVLLISDRYFGVATSCSVRKIEELLGELPQSVNFMITEAGAEFGGRESGAVFNNFRQ